MEEAPRDMNEPQEGFFKMRAWRRGPWIPARIVRPIPTDPLTGEVMDRYPKLQAFIGDTEVEIDSVWLYGRTVDKEEWEWLRALYALQRQAKTFQTKARKLRRL